MMLKVEIERLQEELSRVEAKRVDVNGRMEKYSEAVEQRLKEGKFFIYYKNRLKTMNCCI